MMSNNAYMISMVTWGVQGSNVNQARSHLAATCTRGKLGPKGAQNLHKQNTKKQNNGNNNNRGQGSNACSHLAATRTRGKLRPNNTKKNNKNNNKQTTKKATKNNSISLQTPSPKKKIDRVISINTDERCDDEGVFINLLVMTAILMQKCFQAPITRDQFGAMIKDFDDLRGQVR